MTVSPWAVHASVEEHGDRGELVLGAALPAAALEAAPLRHRATSGHWEYSEQLIRVSHLSISTTLVSRSPTSTP